MSMNKKNFYETRERVRKLHEKFGATTFTSREAGELLGLDMSDAHAEPYRKFMSDFQRLKTMMVVIPVDTKINPDTGRIADYYLIVDKDVGAYNKRFSPEEKKRRQQRAQEIRDNYIKNIKMKHRFIAPTKSEMNSFFEEHVEKKEKEAPTQPVQQVKVEETKVEETKEEEIKDIPKFSIEIKIHQVFGPREVCFEQHDLTLDEVKARLTAIKDLV